MDDSGKKLSKQRRRRRILMHDDDDDDSTPSKIQELIQSEPSQTTYMEKSTSSYHTERSTKSSIQESQTTSKSKTTFSSSNEFETSSWTTSGHAGQQKSSYESFTKNEVSKVESYSDFTKTESTYRSYIRTDESTSVHKGYRSNNPTGLASIENLKGAEGFTAMHSNLGEIDKSEHTSGSFSSHHDFGKISRDDRDISITDTGKSRTYHDRSIQEGHTEKSEKNSSEQRRFLTDSEKYSYSDKENTQIDYTRREHHEVTERRGFVPPEEITSILGRYSRMQDERKDGNKHQYTVLDDSDIFHTSTNKASHTDSADLSQKRAEPKREIKEKTKFEVSQGARSDDPDEMNEIHVASIRDRVRLMRASMRNQYEEQDVKSGQDHETVIDIRFSSDSVSDNQEREDLISIEELAKNQTTGYTENETEQNIYSVRESSEAQAEHKFEPAYVNVTNDFTTLDTSKDQDEQEIRQNQMNTEDSLVESKRDLENSQQLLQSILSRHVEPTQPGISNEVTQQDRAIAVYTEAPSRANVSEQETNKFSVNASDNDIATYTGELVQQAEKQKYNVMEYDVLSMKIGTTKEHIEKKVPQSLTDVQVVESDTLVKTQKSCDEIQAMESENLHKIPAMPAEIGDNTSDQGVDFADGIQSRVNIISEIGENAQSEDEKITLVDNAPGIQTDIDDNLLITADQDQLNTENKLSNTETGDFGEKRSGADVTTSDITIRQTVQHKISDEIITIQTGIITSHEQSADQSKQPGIPQKTVGSDEVIIIHGIPMRRYDDVTMKSSEAKQHQSQTHDVEPRKVQTYEEMSYVVGLHDKHESSEYGKDKKTKDADEPHAIQQSKISQHEIKESETTTSSRFAVAKFNLRSYAPRPYQKPPANPSEKQLHQVSSFETRGGQFSFSSLHQVTVDEQTEEKSKSVNQPYETPPHEQETDNYDYVLHKRDADEPVSSEKALSTESQSKDSVHLHLHLSDIKTTLKPEDVKQPYETPPRDEESDEFMFDDSHIVQMNDNVEFREQTPDARKPVDTTPHEKVLDEPMVSEEGDDEESQSSFSKLEERPTVEEIERMEPVQPLLDSFYQKEEPKQNLELHSEQPHDTLPHPDSEPEAKSVDMKQPHELQTQKLKSDNEPIKEYKVDEIQPKEMTLGEPDSYEDEPDGIQIHKTSDANAEIINTEYFEKEKVSENVPLPFADRLQHLESSPSEIGTLVMPDFVIEKNDAQSDDQTLPKSTVLYTEETPMEESPEKTQTDEASEPNSKPLETSDLQAKLRLTTESQPMDTEDDNEISITTRREKLEERSTVETIDGTEPVQPLLDSSYQKEEPKQNLEPQSAQPHDTLPHSDSEPEAKSADMKQPHELQTQKLKPDNEPTEEHKVDGMQPKEMTLGEPDSYEDDPDGIQIHKTSDANAEKINTEHFEKEKVSEDIPLPFADRLSESSPSEIGTLVMPDFVIEKNDAQSNDQTQPKSTVLYTEEKPMEESPEETQTDEAKEPNSKPLETSDLQAKLRLTTESQPMDIEDENEISITTRREVVTNKEITVHELYSMSTEYETQNLRDDLDLNTSLTNVQVQHVIVEDKEIEAVDVEPSEDVQFEQILVLDDEPEEGALSDTEQNKQHEESKEQSFENIDKELPMEVEHPELFHVERRSVRTYETTPYESRSYAVQPLEILSIERQPNDEQTSDKKDDISQYPNRIETYDIKSGEEETYKKTIYESKQYEVRPLELQTFETQPYETQPKDEQRPGKTGNVTSESPLYHTVAYNVEKRQIRSYETTPYETYPNEVQSPELLEEQSNKEQSSDKTDDLLSDLNRNETNDAKSREEESYKPSIYDSHRYQLEKPLELHSFETHPEESEPSDSTSEDDAQHTEAYDVDRYAVRSRKELSNETQETKPIESFRIHNQNERSDETSVRHVYHPDVEKREIRSYETMSYESRPYDLPKDDLPDHEVALDQISRGKHPLVIDFDDHQNNAHEESILESPSRKRKFRDSHEELKDEDELNAPHVVIKRKVRITTATGSGDKRMGEEKYTHGPSASADQLQSNEVVEDISSTKRCVLESTQEQVDTLFNAMEYEITDNQEQMQQNLSRQSRKDLKTPQHTDLERTEKPLRKYRVDCHIQLSPVERPELKKPLKSWKSEPILNTTDPIYDNNLRKTRRWKSMNFEKKVPKQSSILIELQKPQRRPLAPAYSIDNLPFETIIRNEVNIKLKKKRRKSYPSAKVLDDVHDDEFDGQLGHEIQPREIQTEEIKRDDVKLSESFETVDTFFEDHFNEERKEIPGYNKENTPGSQELLDSSEQSSLTDKNVAPITKDHKNPRKSRLNVTPITIRPKSLKEKPTYVAVKQKRSSDITYGRIESTPSYTLHHAVTEKPRDDIIIEVTPLEDENNGLPEQQENDEESFKEDTKEMVSDIAQTDRYERTNEDKGEEEFLPKTEVLQTQEQSGQIKPVPDTEERSKPKRSTKRRQKILVDKRDLEQSTKSRESLVSLETETPMLEEEPYIPNEENETVKSPVDIERYLEDNSHSPEERYSIFVPEERPSRILIASEVPHKIVISEDLEEPGDQTNINTFSNSTGNFPTKEESLHPVNIQQYLGNTVDDKKAEKTEVDEVDNLEPHETYEANKEIQRLLEKASDDEDEPVKPHVTRQAIEVILIDETKKTKKKKSKKKRGQHVYQTFDDTTEGEPTSNKILSQDSPTVNINEVPQKKERVATKEIAVQTMPVPEDIDSEEDSDQEILQYQQRSSIAGYLINTIPEEQEDESPQSSPDESNFTGPVDQDQFNRERGFLFRDTRDHEQTPKHPLQRTEKPTFSDTSILPLKYLSEPVIEPNAAKIIQSSPYVDGNQKSTILHPDFTVDNFLYETSSENERETDNDREQFSQPIYKPRLEIQDFVEEEKKQRGAVAQAPPSKKYKMSSPHSPTDTPFLKNEHRAQVAEKTEYTSSSHQNKYEIHDFIKQDVQESFKPIQPTNTKELEFEEMEEESPYIDPKVDEKGEEFYEPNYKGKGDMEEIDGVRKEDIPKHARHDYQRDSVRDLQPTEAKSETDRPKYQPRVELVDLLRDETKNINDEARDRKTIQELESPTFLIGEREQGPIFHQPRYEVRNFLIEEKPDVADKGDQDYQELENGRKPAYEPRYVSDGISDLESQREQPATPTSYQPHYQISDVVSENRSQSKTAKQVYVVNRITASATFAEEDLKPADKRPEPVNISPVYAPECEIQNFLLVEESPEREESPEYDESQHSSTGSSPLPEEQPRPSRSFRRPKLTVDDFVIDEKSQSKDKSSKTTPDENITLSSPVVNIYEKRHPTGFSQQDIEPAFVPLSEEEPETSRLDKETKYEIRDFVVDKRPNDKDMQEHPETIENVNVHQAHTVETEPEPDYRAFKPRKIREFVIEDEPKRRYLQGKSENETPTKSFAEEYDNTSTLHQPEQRHLDKEPKYKITDFVLEEHPIEKEKPEDPGTFETVNVNLINIPEKEQEPSYKASKSRKKREFVIEEEPQQKSPLHEPENSRSLHEPKYEISDFALEDKSEKISRDTKQFVPLTEEEPEISRLEKEPKYEIRDFVVDEDPKDVELSDRPQENERVNVDEVPIYENEPKPNYQVFEPTKTRKFVIKDEPKPRSPHEKNDNVAPVKNLKDEPEITKSLHQPKYEINDFVLEEEPDKERFKEVTETDGHIRPSFVPLTEEEPQMNRLQKEPKYEIRDFVVHEDLKDIETSKRPQENEPVNVEVPIYENEPKPNYQVFAPTKTREFVIEDEPKPRSPHEKNDNVVPVKNLKDEPEITKSLHQPKYEINDFVLEEEPDKQHFKEVPETDGNIKPSFVPLNEEEPEMNRIEKEPKYEIRDFVVDEDPKDVELSERPQENERVNVDEVSIYENEPKPNYQVFAPTKTRKFVIEDEPKPTSPLEKNDNVVPVKNLEDEPKITKSLHQPKYEINYFVLEEEPEKQHFKEVIETDGHVKPSFVPLTEEEPQMNRIEKEPKYEIRDFVVDEDPKDVQVSERPQENEPVNVDEVPIYENEPKPNYQVFAPTKTRKFVIKDEPKPRSPLEKNDNVAPVKNLEDEPEITKSLHQPKYEINYFVLEEEPEKEHFKEVPETDGNIKPSFVPLNEEEPEMSRIEKEPKYEIRDFVVDEDPKDVEVSKRPQENERVNVDEVPIYENKPKPNYQVFAPTKTRKFVIEDEPKPTSPLEKNDNVAPVKKLEDEPEITKSLHQPKYEINELVLEEEPDKEHFKEITETDRDIKPSFVPLTEEEPEMSRLEKEPQYKIRDFVVDEDPKDVEVSERPQENKPAKVDEVPIYENEPKSNYQVFAPTKTREFVIQDEPKRRSSQEKNDEVPEVNDLKDEPEITKLQHQPKYEINDLSLEEEPDKQHSTEVPKTDGYVKLSFFPLTEEEPETNRLEKEPKYEIRDFDVDEYPEDTVVPEHPLENKPINVSEVPIYENEPTLDDQAFAPSKTREFIIQNEPTQTSPHNENENVPPVNNLKDEPEIPKSLHQPQYELNDLVLEEEPDKQYSTEVPEMNGGMKPLFVTLIEEEPKTNRLEKEPKYEIRDFVVDEHSKYIEAPNSSDKNEPVNVNGAPIYENEPTLNHQALAPTKIREFVIEDEPKPRSPHDENENVPEVNNLKDEPEITMSEYDINEEEPEKRHLKFPEMDGGIKSSNVPLTEEEPKTNQLELKYEIRDLAVDERPGHMRVDLEEDSSIRVKTIEANNDNTGFVRSFETRNETTFSEFDEEPPIKPPNLTELEKEETDEAYDEPTRLDIDHTVRDKSERVGENFRNKLQNLLSDRSELERKPTVTIQEEAKHKPKNNPLENMDKIKTNDLSEDKKQPEIDFHSSKNDLKNEIEDEIINETRNKETVSISNERKIKIISIEKTTPVPDAEIKHVQEEPELPRNVTVQYEREDISPTYKESDTIPYDTDTGQEETEIVSPSYLRDTDIPTLTSDEKIETQIIQSDTETYKIEDEKDETHMLSPSYLRDVDIPTTTSQEITEKRTETDSIQSDKTYDIEDEQDTVQVLSPSYLRDVDIPTITSQEITDKRTETESIQSDKTYDIEDGQATIQMLTPNYLRDVDIPTITSQEKTPEITDKRMETEELDEIKSEKERTYIQQNAVTVFPPTKPQGITIELVDDIPEPEKPKYEGTAVIEKLNEPGRFENQMVHIITTNTSTTSGYDESQITTANFVANQPQTVTSQRFVQDIDRPAPIVDEKPIFLKDGMSLDVSDDVNIETLAKKPGSSDREYLVSSVNSKDEQITRKIEFSDVRVTGTLTTERKIGERKEQSFTLDQKAHTKREPITVYPSTNPQGITVQLIDDILEPAKPKYEGTATIETFASDEEQLKKRTTHTITNNVYQENPAQQDIEQRFVKDFGLHVSENAVDGGPGMIAEASLSETDKESENTAIQIARERPSLGVSESYGTNNTREEFEKVDMVNMEESEIISIASGTSSVNLEGDEKINIEPSLFREVDTPTLIVTERPAEEQEMGELSRETTGIIIPLAENIEKSEERSFEVKTSDLNSLEISSYDKDHIYARVNKSELHKNDEDSLRHAKTSADSVLISHQPGATAIVRIEKNSLRHEETENNFTEVKMPEVVSPAVEKKIVRETYHQSDTREEIRQSENRTDDVSHTEAKQVQGVVWMTVRHKKRLFDASDSRRVITLPIVNKIPSEHHSPTENLDFVLVNDEEMFVERRASKPSEDYYTTTHVNGQEQVQQIPGNERGVMKESEVANESDKNQEQHDVSSSNVTNEFQETDVVEKHEIRDLQIEHSPDHDRTDEYESALMNSEKYSEDLKVSRASSDSEVVRDKEISRTSVRQTFTMNDDQKVGNDVWCTVRMKRWGSDIRRQNLQQQSGAKEFSERSSSTASIDGSYERNSPRSQSPTSEFSLQSETSKPRISVRQKRVNDVNVNTTSIKINKDGDIAHSFSRNVAVYEAKEQVGYSMQITATDDGPLMTQEQTLTAAETSSIESTQSSNMADTTTLPWIEVRKRDSIKQRLSFSKKKRDGTLKGVPHTTAGKDRLLLIKIPQSMLTAIENDDKMVETEVEIPWMELDRSSGEHLPWVELADQDEHNQKDRILMLKISRQMILQASKESPSEDSEIQLPWNEAVKYWEETGQITPGSLSRVQSSRSANIAIAFPSEAVSENEVLDQNPNLPNMRLILPKKCCLDGSLRLKPIITVNEKRNIKVRINKSVKKKHDWNTVLRLSKSERRKKYSHISGQDDWVVLADGTNWWRLQVDDMGEFDKIQPRSDGHKFENYFEISSEDTDGRESIDLNDFAKQLGSNRQKQFSFVIDPKNLLSSTMSF